MAYSALVFPILVMALITVWRSASLGARLLGYLHLDIRTGAAHPVDGRLLAGIGDGERNDRRNPDRWDVVAAPETGAIG